MRISDWSSDVCSSDLQAIRPKGDRRRTNRALVARWKQAAAYRKITFFGDFVNQAIASNPEPISLRNDIRTLGKTLGDVIKDCEGKAIYDVIEKLRRAAVKFRREGNIKDGRILERQIARLEDEQASSVARAFSYFLHLSNIAEDRDQNRRQRQHALHAQAPKRERTTGR